MTAVAATPRKFLARHITDLLEPKKWIIAVTVLIGWHSGHLTGIGWGLLGALFAAVLPSLFIQHGIRRARFADRHVGTREHRLIVMAFIIASVTIGVCLQAFGGAPRPVLALTVTMLAAITVLMAITVAWKISVHCAVSSGATIMLALTYGATALALYVLVALVAWSRSELNDHTPAQAVAGSIFGAALSAAIFVALR
jgi:FlaA1/EpsC-like NDP-sugar epimerase